MYFVVYWMIVLYIGIFVLTDLLKEKQLKHKVTAFIVIIPFILRLLLVK